MAAFSPHLGKPVPAKHFIYGRQSQKIDRADQTRHAVCCAFKALSRLREDKVFGNRNALQLRIASDTLSIGPSHFPIPHFITCRENIPGRCPAQFL
jgi:hypothetical protein